MRKALLLAVLLSGAAFAGEAGGLSWTAPKGWAEQGPRPMRAATYVIPAAKGDAEPAELGVFYFGQGQGGSVDANLKRWIGQFEQPDGGPSDKAAKTTKEKIGGLDVTLVEVTGTYTASMGPMSPVKDKKPGYRLLGAIVEGPQGPLFFKLTGPDKTVSGARPAFQKMLKTLKAKGK